VVKVGHKASAEQFGRRELVEYAVLAERAGLDSVTISDNFQPWRHNGGHALFSLSWLAAMGERTERVLLGMSVMTPTFRYSPAVIAQAFGTLACLYPGRVILGVGSDETLNEVAVTSTRPAMRSSTTGPSSMSRSKSQPAGRWSPATSDGPAPGLYAPPPRARSCTATN
jgi:alkanesulfonate monooxygenase SsuD/methylene tetrahydromethanopterin reductase-like flavin-dependent oxidoreductase (luciferase family)